MFKTYPTQDGGKITINFAHITHIIWNVDVATVCTQGGIIAMVANVNQLEQDLSTYNKKQGYSHLLN
jgi:hypothetical protein